MAGTGCPVGGRLPTADAGEGRIDAEGDMDGTCSGTRTGTDEATTTRAGVDAERLLTMMNTPAPMATKKAMPTASKVDFLLTEPPSPLRAAGPKCSYAR